MMASRRIKPTTVLAWGGGTGIPIVIAIFLMLQAQGDITITGYSGDVTCAGTEDEPCVAEINFTANKDIFLYPFYQDKDMILGTDVELKDLVLKRTWGRGEREIPLDQGCSGSWCGCYWCKYGIKAVYSYAFREGNSYTVRFYGYKNDPFEDVKWSFGEIDPLWAGIGEYYLVEKIAGREYTPNCLEECHLPFNVTLYQKKTVNKNKFDRVLQNQIGKIHFKEWHYDYLVNTTYFEVVENCTYTEVHVPAANGTLWQSTTETCFPYQVEKWRYEWKPITGNFKFKTNEFVIIDIWAKKTPSTEFVAVDVIPKIDTYLFPSLAWWNSSYPYRRNITGSTESNIILPVNGTSGTDLANSTKEWIYCIPYNGSHSVAVYYNDENDTRCADEVTEQYRIQTAPAVGETGTPPADLLQYYPLDETSGTISGFGTLGNDGTNTGADSTTGHINNAWSFVNANNDNIDLNWQPDSTFFGSNHTISFWFKSTSSDNYQAAIGVRNSGTAHYLIIYIPYDADDHISYTFRNQGEAKKYQARVDNSTITDGNFHYLTFIADPTANTIEIYVDGVLQTLNEVTSDSPSAWSSNVDLMIGAYNNQGSANTGEDLDAVLDDFRIYNRSLTYNEIQALYSLGTSMTSEEAQSTTTTTTTTPADTCTPPGSGNWDMDITDNCNLSSQDVEISGNLTIYNSTSGGGTFTILDSNLSYHFRTVNATGEVWINKTCTAGVCIINKTGGT